MFKLVKTSSRAFSSGGRKIIRKPTRPTGDSVVSASSAGLQAPPPAADLTLAWQEVKDPATGQVYFWNRISNETTALGAPRPTGPTALVVPGQQQQQSLGGMVVEGLAWGTGMSIARHMVGSVFGMFGGGNDDFSV